MKKVWVPPAYRPLESSLLLDRNSQENAVDEEQSNRNEQLMRREIQRKEYEERLGKLLAELTVQASTYRGHFRESATESTAGNLSLRQGPDLLRNIKALVLNMHEADVLVNRQKLQKSFPSYAELCRTLQHICAVSCNICSIAPPNDSSTVVCIDLAEATLLELIRLSQDRMMLIETANKWNKPPAVVQPPESPSRRNSVVSGWLSNVVKKVLAPFSETETSTPDVPYSSSAEQSINQVTQQQIRNVMMYISCSDGVPLPSAHPRAENDLVVPSTETSQRLFALLDSIPPKWSVNRVVLGDVMEILVPIGTLESARKCKLLFDRQPQDDAALPFSHVLDAYLATIQNDPSPSQQIAIVEEVIEVLEKYWNVSKATGVYSKRASHCSIVLHCMTKVKWGDTPGLCDKAEALVEKALGRSMYSDVKSQFGSEKPDMPTQVMPLMNYLASIFASSGQPSRVVESWQILDAITKQCHSSGLKVYPDAATANQVLFALANLYRANPTFAGAQQLKLQAIDFATSLVEYMHSRGDRTTWPSRETYDGLFDIIHRTNPPDAAERTQRLLHQFETRRSALQDCPDSGKSHRLMLYHRTLKKWAQAAHDRAGSTEEENIIPCVEASRLVDKLVIQSSPMIFPEIAIEKLVPFLYDSDLRPQESTYLLVLKVCARTTNPKHWETAAQSARKVVEKSRVQLKTQHIQLLELCSAKLPEESSNKQQLDSLVASLLVEQEDSNTKSDVDEDNIDVSDDEARNRGEDGNIAMG